MTRHTLMGGRHWLAALLVLMLTAACGAPDTGSSAARTAAATPVVTAPQNPLTIGSWQLVSYGPAAEPSKPISSTPTLSFAADGSLGGAGGCNSFFGSYVLTGTTMTIDGLGRTEMACMPQELMAQEDRYLAALADVSAFVHTDNTLTLRYPEGELVFEHIPAPPARTLENTAWRFNGFVQGDAVSMIAGGDAITAELRAGKITGNAGCNRYNAPATIQGRQLSIGPIISTKMACDATPAEQQFLAALQTVTAWEIDDQTLTLNYPGGGLSFVAE